MHSIRDIATLYKFKSVKLAWGLEFGIRFIPCQNIARAMIRVGIGLGLR